MPFAFAASKLFHSRVVLGRLPWACLVLYFVEAVWLGVCCSEHAGCSTPPWRAHAARRRLAGGAWWRTTRHW